MGFPTSFCFLVFLLYHLLSLSAHCLPLRGFAHLQSCAFPSITLLQSSELSRAQEEPTLQGFLWLIPFLRAAAQCCRLWVCGCLSWTLPLENVLLTSRNITREIGKGNPVLPTLYFS